jgi:hypothetical protein
MQTLMIQDLPASKELDRKAMTAVRGGVGDLGLVNNQGNVQVVNLAAAGPVVKGDGNLVMHDVTVDQTASNTATNTNAYGVSIYPYWW